MIHVLIETQGGGNMWFKSEDNLSAEILHAWGVSVFVLLRPSTDWMKPTHVLEDSWALIKLQLFEFILIQKHSHRNTSK